MSAQPHSRVSGLLAIIMMCAAFTFAQSAVQAGRETRVDQAPMTWGITGQTVQAVVGDRAHLIGWTEYPPLGGDVTKMRVMTRREAGNQALEKAVQVSTTPSSTGGLGGLQLCVRGNTVYAAWERVVQINPFLNTELRFSRSFDGGKTWSHDLRIHPAGLDTSDGFALACGPNRQVWVALAGARASSSHTDFVRSNDDGAHWTAPVQIDHSPASATRPTIAATDNGNIVVVWDDGRVVAGGQTASVFGNSSTDGGNTFQNVDALVSKYETTQAQLGANGVGHFCALFEAIVSGWNAFSTSSSDGGLSWSEPLRLDEGERGIEPFTLQTTTSGNGQVHTVVVYDQAAGPAVYYRASDDNGLTYRAPIRLDVAPAGTKVFFMNIAANGSGLVAIPWAQLKTGLAPGIVLARISTDSGQTWSGITTLSARLTTSRAFPVVSLDNDANGAAVAWTENKSPQQKLFFNILAAAP